MLHTDDQRYIAEHLPFLAQLSRDDLDLVTQTASFSSYQPSELLLSKGAECNGMILVRSGQLRAFLELEDGKEITLYRLLAGDVCILSASCILKNISFEITLEAEKESKVYRIPAMSLSALSEHSPAVKQFTMDLVATRFSEVMWVTEQIVSKNMGQRVAAFLLEQSVLESSSTLTITHDTIARNLGTAREVVSRILKYLENDGMLKLSRGKITLVQSDKLREISQSM